MSHVALEPFAAATELPESPDPVAASAAHYANEVVELLSELMLQLVRQRAPEVEPVLRGERAAGDLSAELLARTLQVQGIWFQLLSIAEQNAAMRRRRQIEAERGLELLRGTFAQVCADAAAAKVPAAEIHALLERLRVRPVITAHPTEAKRVTVLEKHRRIYRRLVDLESPRWTPRERQSLVDGLRNEIELLWLTGELRLQKPTVPQEVFWGLHFFNETLFEAVPDLIEKLERVLAHHYPDERWVVPTFFQFGSWIGGDRDGNPFVTNDVTHSTLLENRLTGLRRYRRRIEELVRALSITERAVTLSDRFRGALERALASTGRAEEIASRNPGEVFRQYLGVMLQRIQAMIEATERGDTRPNPAGYASADALLADLKLIEDELMQAGRPEIAGAIVRPVRREVESFRFSTVRLDVRENTTKLNAALRDLWRAGNEGDPPETGSDAVAGLDRRRAGPAADRRRGVAAAARGDGRDAGDVRAGAPPPGGDRPRGVRRLRPQHDAERERRARRLPPRQDRGTVRRRARRGELHPADRAAVRDHRRPPAGAGHHARAARGAAGQAQRPRPGRGPGGDDRLLGLEQGRRVPDLELGAVQGPDQAHPGRERGGRADRVLSRPRRLGQPGRRADRPRHRGPAGRVDRRTDADHRAGRGGVVQVRQPRHRAVPDRAAGGERRGAHAQVGARGGAGAHRRIRRGDGGAVGGGTGGLPQARGSRGPAAVLPGREPARGDLPAQPGLPPGAALRRPIAQRPPGDSLGLRLVAEPALRARVVRRGERDPDLRAGARRSGDAR